VLALLCYCCQLKTLLLDAQSSRWTLLLLNVRVPLQCCTNTLWHTALWHIVKVPCRACLSGCCYDASSSFTIAARHWYRFCCCPCSKRASQQVHIPSLKARHQYTFSVRYSSSIWHVHTVAVVLALHLHRLMLHSQRRGHSGCCSNPLCSMRQQQLTSLSLLPVVM
jgi:hypothetical protein